jgi:ubiquinone biosynthesis accessory factor UbiK
MPLFKELDELATKIVNKLPGEDSALSEDFRKNVRALLESAFRDMDLVTREEYEVQVALLARTRERLEKMQETLNQLEP